MNIGDSTWLSGLGISPICELVYRWLLRHPGQTEALLAAELKLEREVVQDALDELQRLGFVNLKVDGSDQFLATPPELAVETLLQCREAELREARLAIPRLVNDANVPGGDFVPRILEVIASDELARRHPYQQVHRGARSEVLCLVRPPFLVSKGGAYEEYRREARARGVRYRNIVHPDTLALEGWPQLLREAMKAGEEVRLLGHIPFKFNVSDRDYAILPMMADDPDGLCMVVRKSLLLDALVELFEAYWTLAVPLEFAKDGSLISQQGRSTLPTDLQPLITLLAAGINDKSIGDFLGISERTLVRRIDRLYRTLHVKSRFQAGWQAALRSVSPDSMDAPEEGMPLQ